MKRLLLALTFIFIVSGVSAQNISFSYPEEISVGEEFIVKIGLTNFPGGNYDLKFDTSKSGGNLLRVLNNGQWKSNYYYIIGAISNNEEKEFTLKVEEYIGTISTIIKTRLSGTSNTESFEGYEIESLETIPEEPVEEAEEDEETTEEENVVEERPEIEEHQEIEEPVSRKTEPIELQTINLNPQVIKSEDDNENLSKSNYAIYGLVFFCVLLVVLFILRKNKYNKNEFR